MKKAPLILSALSLILWAPLASAAPTSAGAAATAAAPTAAPVEGTTLNLHAPASVALTAPEQFVVKLATTKGELILDVHRAWAPLGVDRFYSLVKAGYYNQVAFFRVIRGFMAQVGIHGDPTISTVWRRARIQDDPVRQSNTRGMVSFATAGPNTRTTQFFINFGNNMNLDRMGFAPFARVRNAELLDQIYSGYGEGKPRGNGPSQAMLHQRGNSYLQQNFPRLDYIISATVVE